MRNAVVGGVVAASLVIVGTAVVAQPQGGARPAQPLEAAASSNRLIAFTAPAAENRQQLTIIDPEARVVGVYHVDASTGVITLKSVRNIHWDLQMMDYNGAGPLPRDIRAQVEQR